MNGIDWYVLRAVLAAGRGSEEVLEPSDLFNTHSVY